MQLTIDDYKFLGKCPVCDEPITIKKKQAMQREVELGTARPRLSEVPNTGIGASRPLTSTEARMQARTSGAPRWQPVSYSQGISIDSAQLTDTARQLGEAARCAAEARMQAGTLFNEGLCGDHDTDEG